MKTKIFLLLIISALTLTSCKKQTVMLNLTEDQKAYIDKEVKKYFEYELKADLSHLSQNQIQMLNYLFEAAKIMDTLFWMQASGPYAKLINQIDYQPAKKLFKINYGPWNRLDANKPFLPNVPPKPKGAFFYPEDMTEEEFQQLDDPRKTDLYTVIVRDENGQLKVVPYSQYYKPYLEKAADLLKKAAQLAEDPGFKRYLELRAQALLTDNYFDSDTAWMSMKNNKIEFIIGPIETYEDQLFGYKAAFEAFILIKDLEWSKKLEKYSSLLPQLQKMLPVPDEYKQDNPGTNSDLNAYDAIYYAGDCNAGSKTIAINLPNDEQVQKLKGSRRLQIKNAMRAKFENIVIPISKILIDPEQQNYVKFDAFFQNTMFHEVAHGLGVKYLVNNPALTVRKALGPYYTTLEEGKADILGLWLIEKLVEMNELDADLMSNYVTFVTSIFRSIRFGTTSAHGKANLIRFNFFMEKGAIERSQEGYYSVNPEKLKDAELELIQIILTLQGDGDQKAAKEFIDKYLFYPEYLKQDLQRLEQANIPVDVVWKQGKDIALE